ncbi:uncharacterized protein C8A04DRAFT_24251 [Dichotomopilus funicola]|uniref:Uncharacterized protein n=1 Tax=Dichotomopilus funicola TaxID=1934379 RepID=A0AAN6VA55_9PEZI|nr:hypothetical protein C8A04DRAFT_24251 [Dichotomopilus funicola]
MDANLFPTEPRHQFHHTAKVLACGSMIGTSILFPLANTEGLWFRALTLVIFVIGALVFHALHIEPFVRLGLYTIAVALVLLLVAVLAAGPSREDLIPWLPLFIASSSLVTVVMSKISRHFNPCPGLANAESSTEYEFSGVSTDTLSDRSFRTLSSLPRPQSAFESTRLDDLYFDRHGPTSVASGRTGTGLTDITLSSVEGRYQPHWDARTRSLFMEGFTLPGQDAMEPRGPQNRTVSPEGEDYPDPGTAAEFSDVESNAGSDESNQPLLANMGTAA